MWGEIVSIMLICLILSAILGGIIGWFLKSLFCKKSCAELEGRIIEKDDEIARLRASVSKVKGEAVSENRKDDTEINALKAKISTLETDLRVSQDRQVTLESDLKGWEGKASTLVSTGAVGGSNDEEVAKLKAELQAVQSKAEECEGERLFLLERVKKAESGEAISRRLPESEWDDLELVHGIGPVIERMLYDIGIYTFKEIASWDEAKIDEISQKLPQFKNRIRREGWIESAKEEHFKKYGERL